MFKKIQFIRYSVICLLILCSGFVLNFFCQNVSFLEKNAIVNDRREQIPKLNTIYEEPYIFIDDSDPSRNWSVFAAGGYPWLSGTGTKVVPYVIDNVRVTSGNIRIIKSNVYFRIQNCEGPILLQYVTKGHLDNNFCTNPVGDALRLENSDKNQITNNILDYYDDYGIHLIDSSNNTIFGNTANYYGYHTTGIIVSGNYNVIEQNHASYNDWYGIAVYGDNNTVIRNTLEQNSIGIYGGGYTTITENIAYNNSRAGIWMYFYGYNNITGNFLDYNGEYGIYLEQSYNDTVYNNIGYNNAISGICLVNVYYTMVFGNTMYGCGYLLEGSKTSIASIDIDTSNLVNDKPFYLYLDQSELPLSNFNNAGQIILIDCNDSMISSLDVSNGTIGVSLTGCRSISLIDIYSPYNTLYGIHLKNSINTKIISSNLNQNGDCGLLLENCNNSIITGNDANNNKYKNKWPYQTGHGISIEGGSNNIVSDNIVSYNVKSGINFHGINHTISENTLEYNTESGIQGEGYYHLISGNIAQNNSDYGIHLNDCFNSTVKENTVNKHQLVTCDDTGCHWQSDQFGIFIDYCEYINVSLNIIGENERGISLYHSNYNIIFKNHLDADLSNAITLYYSDNNLLLENLIENIAYLEGINLDWSHNNTIKKNEISNSGEGISVSYCNYNQFLENLLNGMSYYGINLFDSSYNLIQSNTIRAGYSCFNEGGDCIGNSFINNSCEEGWGISRGINGFDLYLMMMSVILSIIVIVFGKFKKNKS